MWLFSWDLSIHVVKNTYKNTSFEAVNKNTCSAEHTYVFTTLLPVFASLSMEITL